MKASATETQVHRTCNDLLALVSTCKAHLNQIAEEHGLTMMQLFALRAVSEGNNATGKIAQIMHCDASNVTGIVDRLVSLHFATRQEDPRDRRVKTVQLTEQGEAMLQDALSTLPSRLGCSNLTNEEAEVLHSAVAKLTLTTA